MNKDEFDRLFDEAWHKAIDQMPPASIPDHRNAWKRIQLRMKAIHRNKTRKTKIARFGLICASFLLGAILFGNPVVTSAFAPIYQSMKELPGQMIAFFFDKKNEPDNEAKTAPPQEVNSPLSSEGEVFQSSVVTPEEASSRIDFSLPSFGYLPSRYTLTRTEIFSKPGERQADQVMYVYANPNQQLFRITLSKLSDRSSIGSGASKDAEAVETVQLPNGKAYFTVDKDGTHKLEFLWMNVYLHMVGSISQEEMIKVAEGIIPS